MSSVEHLKPEGLHHNPAFSQAIAVSGSHRTIYVGGQDAVDEHGQIVAQGDIGAQTRQAFANLRRALAAGGADLEHVVKWTLYVVEGQPMEPGFAAFQEAWGARSNPPTITMAFVAALAHPDFLIEIDAIAVVPE
jgi:enamine deaminase RidA (YjgF/YER057c/UK114 family)